MTAETTSQDNPREEQPAAGGQPFWQSPYFAWGLIALGLLAAIALFWEGVHYMARRWQQPEYNHAYMIPLVAAWMFWRRYDEVLAARRGGSVAGIVMVVIGLFGMVLGEMSTVFQIIQFSFLLVIWGLFLAALGWRGVKPVWPALVYLAFMIPLPRFLEVNLSASLQLISSEIGVAFIRMWGLSVFLEGNVIDLGPYQLQVADACSGMRYMFPLMSFGFLCAVLFQGRWWQRALLFVATIPITVFMNSFRIGVIGILVNFWGIEQAEGFLHDFEGWVVFMASVGILFLMMGVFAWMNGTRLLKIFDLDSPPMNRLKEAAYNMRAGGKAITAVGILAAALLASFVVQRPDSLIPERVSLNLFPLVLGDWRGREELVEQVFLDELDVDDYLMATFTRDGDPFPVQLWIAYYDSQTKGAAIHSPRTCLPGGGWGLEQFHQVRLPGVGPELQGLNVNRAVIGIGEQRQLVYYWFVQQGRTVTNEYAMKWYIFWDGLTRNRTDGALVRVVTNVGDAANLPEADARLQNFIRSLDPQLAYHLPQENAVLRQASAD
ncbi:MAG: VPLPA-CTERM-specific exosortase XrtD [Chromatiales bacterium]|nr:VPLPA-CTERM-specific exosortase XrtD [Chromatiales bacterium]